jgi:hypothetical protein
MSKKDRSMTLAYANTQDDGGWTKFSHRHWRRQFLGELLDYWPTTHKYYYPSKMEKANFGCPYEYMAKTVCNTKVQEV